MFVKAYRYRIRPGCEEDFISIQERATSIYERHVGFSSVHLRSRSDPTRWLEVQWCRDEEAYKRGLGLVDAEPEIEELWRRFKGLLDPGDPDVVEETYDEVLSHDGLG